MAPAARGGIVADADKNVTISFRSPDLRTTVFVWLISLGMILVGIWNDSPPFWHFPILFGVIFFVISVTTYLETGRGTFRLDKGGIQHVSWLKKSRYLAWQDVDQVKWVPHTCCLEGKGTSISVNWSMANTAWARAFVEKILSPHFDLSIKPEPRWSFDPNRRSILIFCCKVLGISLAGTTIFMVGFVGTLFLQPPWRLWLGAAWFFLFLGGFIASC